MQFGKAQRMRRREQRLLELLLTRLHSRTLLLPEAVILVGCAGRLHKNRRRLRRLQQDHSFEKMGAYDGWQRLKIEQG